MSTDNPSQPGTPDERHTGRGASSESTRPEFWSELRSLAAETGDPKTQTHRSGRDQGGAHDASPSLEDSAPAAAPAKEAEPVARTFVTEPAVEQIVVAAAEATETAKPAERAKPELVVVDEAAPKPAEVMSPDAPFFGRPPDDPGVKPVMVSRLGS